MGDLHDEWEFHEALERRAESGERLDKELAQAVNKIMKCRTQVRNTAKKALRPGQIVFDNEAMTRVLKPPTVTKASKASKQEKSTRATRAKPRPQEKPDKQTDNEDTSEDEPGDNDPLL
jgi:hypothetical protein